MTDGKLGVDYVTITTQDGFPLTGTLYHPAPDKASGDVIFMAAATGVQRGYYNKFAHYLMEHGAVVLTLDYRGIGGSRPPGFKGDEVFMHQWGELDIPAAMAYLEERFSPRRLLMVGHSVGGQILSLVPGNERFGKILLVGSQAGALHLWDGLERLKVWFFWRAALPGLVAVSGKLPGWLLGSEDVPKGIALEWRKWGLAHDYILSHGPQVKPGFERVKAPMLFYSFSDDTFAPRRAVEELKGWYSNATIEHRHFHPKDLNVSQIGHFGFFKSRYADSLWAGAAEWLLA
jgi:predicted alpha/beta hydrolase